MTVTCIFFPGSTCSGEYANAHVELKEAEQPYDNIQI